MPRPTPLSGSVFEFGQHPSKGGFSTLNITILHKSLQELREWSTCDSLTSDYRPISITPNLPEKTTKVTKMTSLRLEDRLFSSIHQ